MKTISLAKAREQFRALWIKKPAWRHHEKTEVDPEFWMRDHPGFRLTITNYEDNIFDVAISWGDMYFESYETEKKISDFESMEALANELTLEFTRVAFLSQVSSDELRLTQITGVNGTLFGLDESGKVFSRSLGGIGDPFGDRKSSSWEPLDMVVSKR